MTRPFLTIRTALLLAVALAPFEERAAQGQDDDPSYHARLSDGTFVVGEPLRDWHDANATPRVGSHALFDPARPVQWLARVDPPSLPSPTAVVEFIGGDRLPGEVIGYSSGSESPYRTSPPHLIVRPVSTTRRPNSTFDPPIRVELKHVRQINWVHGPAEPIGPKTAVLRDGQRLTYRALRWNTHGINFLLEDGVRTVSFGELGAVRFSEADVWQMYFDHAATLLPDGDGRLIQIETSSGLIALTSTQRLRAESHGDNRRLDHWYQAIQPAWSLDPVWVPASSVIAWRFFAPERIPLTMLDPTIVRDGVVFSASRLPVANRAVHGGPLSDGHVLFGWGFGVHAPCRLTLPLPPQAVAFRGSYALDPSVGIGGCARVRVSVQTDAGSPKPLVESNVLIGAAEATDLGRVEFPGQNGDRRRQLILETDPVYDGRPAGADPFDIRDAVNWFAPVVELDSDYVRSEIRRRAFSRLPALANWNVAPETSELATVAGRWDTRDWEDPRFRSFATVEAGYTALSRSLQIADDDRFLAVFAHCPLDEFRPARIQVRINGTVIGEQPVPAEHGRREPDPLLYPIGEYAGETVNAEVIQLPGAIDESKPAAIDWRGVELVSHRPGLKPLFEDEAEIEDVLKSGGGSIALETADASTGSASLKIGPPGRNAASVPGWRFVIVEEPDLGEFRFLRYAWKNTGSGPAALSIAHEGRFGPGDGVVVPDRLLRHPPPRTDDRGPRNGYRYLAGMAEKDDVELSPSIVLAERLSEDWRVEQRDLYADFGPFTLTGLGATTRDGSLGLDGVYLARGADQFRYVEEDLKGPPQAEPGEGDVLLRSSNPNTWPVLVSRVAPGFGLVGQGGELQLLKQYRDRADVLRTHPEGAEARQSVRLTLAAEVPADVKSRLAFAVSQHEDSSENRRSWELQVFANGRELLAKTIDHAATNGRWIDETVDLSEFAGRPVRLELRHKSGGRDHSYAYWHNVRLEQSE